MKSQRVSLEETQIKAIAEQLGTLFKAMKAKPAKAVGDAAIEPLKQAS